MKEFWQGQSRLGVAGPYDDGGNLSHGTVCLYETTYPKGTAVYIFKMMILDRIQRERERLANIIGRARWMGRRHFFE